MTPEHNTFETCFRLAQEFLDKNIKQRMLRVLRHRYHHHHHHHLAIVIGPTS
jgi:hypothetical protein